jgi:hypothetical protein
MDYTILLLLIAGMISWAGRVEWKRVKHKKQVEQNYREYKNRAK